MLPGQGNGHDDSGVADDRLRLMFTCCHPAVPRDAMVALTLRAGGRPDHRGRSLGRSWFPTETMAERLSAPRPKIRDAAIPSWVPPAHRLPERTVAVLAVLYALFNEGYGATAGPELVRQDLCAEAIRLARLLASLMPDEPEALGLLSLMLLHDARRPARVDAAGDLVTLEDQDRSLWDREAIGEGRAILDTAGRLGRSGPYQVMAAIAACHASARAAAETDWAEIASLYARLSEVVPTPVVALNRAVAVAMSEGPAAGLGLVEELERSGNLSDYHLLPATRADLLRRVGRKDEAAASYRRALELASTEAERRYLIRRLEESSSDR